ncbi:hypothetical protein [Streptomyces sp. NPDC001070]
MRYIIDLYHRTNDVHGHLLAEDADEPVVFHGWLELLRLLEPRPRLPEPTEPAGDGPSS